MACEKGILKLQSVSLEPTLLLLLEIARSAQITVKAWRMDWLSVPVLKTTTELRLERRTCLIHVSPHHHCIRLIIYKNYNIY